MDYSYLGSGNVSLREVGAAAPLLRVGNCSQLQFAITEEVKELKDFTQPGGGTYNEVRRIQAVEVTITMHDLSPDNLARAVYGQAANTASGTVTAEAAVARVGGVTPLAKIPTAITSVEPAGGGTAYTAGTDYVLSPAGLFIPEGSTIPAPTGSTPNIEVDYTSAEFDTVQALTQAGKEYELLFEGLNEARSGKTAVVHAFRVKIGAARNISLIGEDYAALEVTGKLLKDTTKTGAGVSQYFLARLQK